VAAIDPIADLDDPAVGPWILVAPLGSGAQGRTWLAHDSDGLEAAVKLLPQPPGAELEALARVVHPAVPALLGSGTAPRPWLAMERVSGRTLGSRAHPARRWPPERVAQLLVRLADALAACHQAGLCHGDVKPSNIVVADDALAWLVDFGLAGERGGGTAGYSAPERFHAEGSAPADVYSLGLVAYELLSGRLPGLNDRLTRELPPLELPRGHAALGRLIGSMVARRPAERPSASDVVDELEALGFAAPEVTSASLAGRAARCQVHRPVHEALERFVAAGGRVKLTGPSGSGRHHALRWVRHRLWAEGLIVAMVQGNGRPWEAIRQLLRTRQLPGSPHSLVAGDRVTRAWAAAEAVRMRASGRLHVLVDAADLDAGSRDTLAALAEQGDVALLWFGELPVEPTEEVALSPWSRDDAVALVRELLGAEPPEGLVEALVAPDEPLWPGRVVEAVLRGVHTGALQSTHRAWVSEAGALRSLVAELGPGTPSVVPTLSGPARALGAFVAAYGEPIDLDRALGHSRVGQPGVVQELVSAGVMRSEARYLHVPSAARRRALLDAVAEPEAVWLRVLAARRAEDPPDPEHLAWAAVGAGEHDAMVELGPAGVHAALRDDVLAAQELAEALTERCDALPLQRARLAALAAGERHDEARKLGRELLEREGPDAALVARLMTVEIGARDVDACRAWLALAPVSDHPDLLRARAHLAGIAGDFEETLRVASILRAYEVGSEAWQQGVVMATKALGALQRSTAAVALVEESLEQCPQLSDDVLLMVQYSQELGRLRKHRRAAEVAEAAAERRLQLSMPDRAAVTHHAGIAWYEGGDLQRALRWWAEAATAWRRLSIPAELVKTLVNLCEGYRVVGRVARALEVGQEALAQARAIGFDAAEIVVLGNLGDLALQQGDLDEARACYERAWRRGSDQPGVLPPELHAYRQARLALGQHHVVAVRLVQEALEAVPAGEAHDEARARALALVAVQASREGERNEVRRLDTQATELLRRHARGAALAEVRADLAEAWLELGCHDEALERALRVQSYAEEFGRQPLRARADRVVEACRAHHGGQLDAAEQLNRLVGLSVSVLHERRPDRVVQSIAEAARDLTRADRCLVVTLDHRDEPVVSARVGEGAESPPSWSVVHRCLELNREVVANDIEERGDLRWAESVEELSLHAALCVPWSVDGEPAGAIYVDLRSEEGFHALSSCTGVLRALATFAGVALSNAQRFERDQERVRRAREVVHDMKNSLCAVKIAASNFADEPYLIRSKDLRGMERTTSYCEQVLRRYLDENPVEAEVFDLGGVVADCVEQAQWMARPQQVEVVSTTVEASVSGDRADLSRAVLNLLTNAVKYSPGGGTVQVRMHTDERAVFIEVCDEGPGVPAGYEERIFEPDAQAPGARAGHGIGLPSARSIVRGHGGQLDVRDDDERGACFVIRLPRVVGRSRRP